MRDFFALKYEFIVHIKNDILGHNLLTLDTKVPYCKLFYLHIKLFIRGPPCE